MQVFLPYPDFKQSLLTLDKTRLGNQIYREAKTLLNGGWANHPVSKIWTPHKEALAEYCLIGLDILVNRAWLKIEKAEPLRDFFLSFAMPHYTLPDIVGYEPFHLSHRLNLLYKLPKHYSQYFTESVPEEKPEYVWKRHEEKIQSN
jgi:hypothetical protein